MKTVERRALLPYSAQAMFDLVEDVEKYQEFLPWCKKSEVRTGDDQAVLATLTIEKGGVTRSFTTRNLLSPPGLIRMSLVEGPFSVLDGRWEFRALGEDGCRVGMKLDFDFDNRLVGLAVSRVFEATAQGLLDAFCRRADALYG